MCMVTYIVHCMVHCELHSMVHNMVHCRVRYTVHSMVHCTVHCIALLAKAACSTPRRPSSTTCGTAMAE